MRFLDDWNKQNEKKQQAGVQRASLPAAQTTALPVPLLTKSGVKIVMPTARGVGVGGNGRTESSAPTGVSAPIVKPGAARSAGKQLVNSGTMVSDTGSNKRQVTPVTAQGAGVGGKGRTGSSAPTSASTPTEKSSAAQRLPNIAAFGAGSYGADKKPLRDFMSRAGKTAAAGALSTAGSFVEVAGQATPVHGEQHLGQFSGFGDLGRAARESKETGQNITAITQRLETERKNRRLQQRQAAQDTATRLFEKSGQYQEEAKDGAGTVGRFLVDMGVTGTQMLGDAAANLLLPGSGLAMMGMRSYGQAANEARRQGKSEEQQFLAGLKSAGIETFTEKMFGAFAGLYGKAGADELVEKLVTKLTKNKTGQAVLTWIVNGVGEGVEEVTSDVLNPLADRVLKLTDGSEPLFTTEDVAQMGYDFLLGAAMGAVGGAGQLVGGVKQGRAQAAEQGYYRDLQRNGLASPNAAANAQRASAAMGRVMPRETGAQGVQDAQQGAAYRGAVPQNVNDPRIGRLEMSSARYNPNGEDIGTVYGNRYRNQVKENAIRRLGIENGKPAYLAAPNITKDGREYYVDVTKASLNKMLYTADHEMLPVTRLLLVDNLEKAIDNSYWAESSGDRKSRPQIDGFDTLRTSFYIDGVPYYADIKVKVVTQGRGNNPQNVAYFLEPEEITSIKRMDTSSPTGGRPAPNIFFRDNVSISDPTIPQARAGVNAQDMQDAAEYARRGGQLLYAGENAKTADLAALERARQMTADGVPPAFIRQETGWYRGMDGKWRNHERQGTGANEDVQYSIHATRDLTIKDQMKEYRAGRLTGHDEFYYGKTPEVLDAAGLAQRPLVMSQTDFRKSRSEKHNVPPRAMTRLAEALGDPVLSFEMGDRLGILTKDIDGDGKPLLIAVQNDVELDGERVNRIKSAYGLDNPQAWIANQIAAGKKLRIYDNKKADSFLNGFGYSAERTESYRLGDTVPEIRGNVNTENSGFVPLELPRLVDENGMDAAQRRAWLGALNQMPEARQAEFRQAQYAARRFGAMVQAEALPQGVQGSYRDGVITISIDAADPVRQVLVHELTHHMERSGLYGRFSDAALRYLSEDMGADVAALRQAVMDDYARAGVTLDEDGAARELVAKFAEEKLFTDEETVRRLLVQDRTLFQRIYDWLRDTAAKLKGTQAQRRLIDARNLYERALRQAASGTQREAGAQGTAAYSLAETRDGYAVAVVDDDILGHMDTSSWDAAKKEEAKKAARNALLTIGGSIRANGNDYKVNRTTRREYTRSNDTEKLYHRERGIFADKMRVASNMDDVVAATRFQENDGGLDHPRKDSFVDFVHGNVLLQAGQNQYEARTVVGITSNGEYVLYDVVDMTPTFFEIEKELSTTAAADRTASDIQESSFGSSIPEQGTGVNIEGVPFSDITQAQLSTGRGLEDMAGRHMSDEDVAWEEHRQRVQAARREAFFERMSKWQEPPKRRGEGNAIEGEIARREAQGKPPTVKVPPVDTWGATFDSRTAQQQRTYAETLSELVTQQVSADMDDMRSGAGSYAYRNYRNPEELGMDEGIAAADRIYEDMVRKAGHNPYTGTDIAEELARASIENERARGTGEKLAGAVERLDELEDAIRADDEVLAMRREAREAEGRTMPETLRRLGVEPFGSKADYLGAEELAAQVSANEKARRRAKKEIAKIPASGKEKLFARQLASGAIGWDDVPQSVNRSTVDVLADFYRIMDTETESQLLRDRRDLILDREKAKMPSLLGMDVRYDEGGLRENGKSSGRVARQVSTLRRNLQTPARVCTTEWGQAHGRRVYETLFAPVTENNGRQISWVNAMLDRVRTFEDGSGGKRELNRTERALVQRLVETSAAEKRVGRFAKPYRHAAENVRNGRSAEDSAREFGIDKSQQEYQDLQNYEAYLAAKREASTADGVDAAVVDAAVKAYGALYQEMYEGINTFLVAHGYRPIGFIEGYAPHLQPEETKTAFSKALKMLGLDDTAMMLPTSISGQTADLKPYKQYDPFFQTRRGDKTEYDIVEGFESYVYYLGNIFYHTDDIMRIRTAAKYIRKTYTDEEASEQISWAENARNFKEGEIEDFLRFNGIVKSGAELAEGDARVILNDYIDGLYEQIGDVSRYSEMVKYLDNYANRLAGKQNMLDRGAEAAAGRRSLNWVNTLTGKYGGAKLAFNVSSALNQTSQLPMVMVENGEFNTAKAIRDFFTAGRGEFVERSNFLKGKKGVQWLIGPETGWERFKELGFSMTEAVDSFTAYVAVRSKYLKEIRAGRSEAEAMSLADEFGRNVMGSRARGEKPMLFDTKNPFWQIATRFQLEAMNSWEHIRRDLPAEFRQTAAEKGKVSAAGQMAGRAARYTLYAFLLNLGIGALSGGSPVPYDLLGDVAEALGAAMGMTKSQTIAALLDGVLEAVFDQRLFGTDEPDDDEDRDWWAALESLFGNVANDVPIVGRAAALAGIGDQTLPTADFSKLADLKTSVQDNGLLSMDTLDKGLTSAGEFIYGGNQLRKTMQGGIAAVQGGVYSKGKLRYPVERTPWKVGKALLFGRGALAETEEYYAKKAKSFSDRQTAAWEKMQEAGEPAKTVQEQRQRAKDGYDLIQQLRGIEKEDGQTRAARQREAIRNADISSEAKATVWYEMLASEADQETVDAMGDGAMGETARILMDMKDSETAGEKLRLILDSSLTDGEKGTFYLHALAADADKEKLAMLEKVGMDAYQYLVYKDASSGMTKKAEKLTAINGLDLTAAQKDALYYAEGWAQSTIGQAPWHSGYGGTYSGGGDDIYARRRKAAVAYSRGEMTIEEAVAYIRGGAADTSGGGYSSSGADDIYARRRKAAVAYSRGEMTIEEAVAYIRGGAADTSGGEDDIYARRRKAAVAYIRGQNG